MGPPGGTESIGGAFGIRSMKFHALPLLATSEALRRGSTDLLGFTRDVLGKLREAEPLVEPLIPEADREGRLVREAEDLLRRFPDPDSRPPLFGIPVGVKDLIRVDGHPTRAGSALPPEAFKGPQASLVTRLQEAGALVLGKTTTDEFAYADPPPTRNPHDRDRTPGGSSAGSAVLVALGLSPLSVGTQTARSVIAPASFCGVFALKPSHGRLPADGVFPLSPAMDVPGLFTQDAEGLEYAAAVLPWTASLDRSGIPLREIPLGWGEDLKEEFAPIRTVLNFEMARAHEDLFPKYKDLYRQYSRGGVEFGQAISEEDYLEAFETTRRFRRDITKWMDDASVDAILLPSQPGPAPLLTKGSTGWGYTTAGWSFAGLPCVTVPASRAEGLPLGLQLVGRYGDDEKLLGWMKEVSQAVMESHDPSA
ncbi:MAG: amidase [Planctomycetota bacterium]|jgi:Asp-tRNA(Asn)/Glu-tRNA(Gln) amidotransferase A subunit family amidase